MNLRQCGIAEECKGTCVWLLDHDEYRTWIEQSPGLLWIKGNPGTGKSTLMKYALETEKPKQLPPDYTVVSYFFHGRGTPLQRSALGLFRSLLHQILTQIPPLLSKFQSMFQSRFQKEPKTQGKPGKDWDWHKEELQDFFKSIIAEKRYRIRIFIDAVDECGEDVAKELVKYFQKSTNSTESTLSICFSSRHYPYIGHGIETICVEDKNELDILTFIQTELSPAFENQRERAEVLEKEIMDKASGIFQWVDLVVSRILSLHKRGRSMKNIRNTLLRIPKELNELYRTILETIADEDRPQALHLMQWVCLATRSLSLTELRFAMVSYWPEPLHRPHRSHCELAKSEEYEDDEQMEMLVRDLSGGLVEVEHQGDERTVQLIHQSVNDFLIQGGLQFLDPSNDNPVGQGHHQLSRSCINYATLEDACEMAQEGLIAQYPFLKYAVTSWVWHAEKAESNNVPQDDLLVRFEWPSSDIWQRWIRTYRAINGGSDECPDEQATLLHITSERGLLSAVKKLLLEEAVNVNSTDKTGRTPLSCAAENGHEAVVKKLLENTADVDSKSRNGQTPLFYAARNGHAGVVKLLLEKKVDVDSINNDFQTPLWYASRNGHEAVVKLLLEKAANIDFKGRDNRTPLWYAAGNGHEEVVKLLLEKAIDVDSGDKKGRTPLSWAADNGHEAVVKLLLGKSVNVNSRDKSGRTPLWYAADNGHEAVVKLLLEKAADADSRDNDGWTPLWWAAGNGHEGVVKLLLEKGVDVDSSDNDRRTPLSCAAENGYEAVVKLLLEKAMNVNSEDLYGQTPLGYALEKGHEGIVKLLLEKAVDVVS